MVYPRRSLMLSSRRWSPRSRLLCGTTRGQTRVLGWAQPRGRNCQASWLQPSWVGKGRCSCYSDSDAVSASFMEELSQKATLLNQAKLLTSLWGVLKACTCWRRPRGGHAGETTFLLYLWNDRCQRVIKMVIWHLSKSWHSKAHAKTHQLLCDLSSQSVHDHGVIRFPTYWSSPVRLQQWTQFNQAH